MYDFVMRTWRHSINRKWRIWTEGYEKGELVLRFYFLPIYTGLEKGSWGTKKARTLVKGIV